MQVVRIGWLAAGAWSVLSFGAEARAQECAPPAPDLYPADGSAGIPLNGVVRVEFHETFEPEVAPEEMLQLFDLAGTPVSARVVFTATESSARLELITDEPLFASSGYEAVFLHPWAGGRAGLFVSHGRVFGRSGGRRLAA